MLPLLLSFPYLVARLVLWAIFQPEIYQHFTQHRLTIAYAMGFLMSRYTQFETLAIVGAFWVIYNLVNDDD